MLSARVFELGEHLFCVTLSLVGHFGYSTHFRSPVYTLYYLAHANGPVQRGIIDLCVVDLMAHLVCVGFAILSPKYNAIGGDRERVVLEL